ncbi:MAG: Wadjet anti-phage system protein JetD domain-containing protein [Verrucomicrobiota bacterium]
MVKPEQRSLVESIAALARGHRVRKVGLDWLWEVFLKKHPELDALERRLLFLAALRAWSESGGCRLPRRKQDWRQDANPALPNWILVLVPKPATDAPSPRESARARGWTPLMQFMANRASVPDLTTAIALDDYIRTTALDALPWVPAKERSVEIFGHGHEKKLERLAGKTGWFTAGGLSLTTLHCFRVPRQPVHAMFPNAKPGGMIISENEAGFHSLCRASTAGAGFGCVVFGDGSEVMRVAEFIQQKARELHYSEIAYFGDVDRTGLDIAVGLAERLRPAALKLVPWVPGYARLLAGVTVGPASAQPEERAALRWLPADLQPSAAQVLHANGHLAQEMCGWTAMAQMWSIPATAGDVPA